MTRELEHLIEKRIRERWPETAKCVSTRAILEILEDLFTEEEIMNMVADEYDRYLGVDFKDDIGNLEEANEELRDQIAELKDRRDELAGEVDDLKAQLASKEE